MILEILFILWMVLWAVTGFLASPAIPPYAPRVFAWLSVATLALIVLHPPL